MLGWLVGVALGSRGLATSRTRGVSSRLAGLMRVHLSVCELSSSNPEMKLLVEVWAVWGDIVVKIPLILGSILLGSTVLAWLVGLGNHFDGCVACSEVL